MDIIQELTWSLSKEEQKVFRKILQPKSNKKELKNLLLFNSLCNPEKTNSKVMVETLYGNYSDHNAGAYHNIRLRLKEQLESFIVQQTDKQDNALYISKLTTIARKLYLKKKYQPAWSYLKEAEEIALKAEEYDLLNNIYQHMVEYAWTQPRQILREVIRKERENQEQAQTTRSISLALSVVKNQLEEAHTKGLQLNIDQISKEVLEEFGVEDTVIKNTTQRYKLAMLVQMSLNEKSDYSSSYQYLIKTLQEMEERNMFDKYSYRYKIELLNSICYSSARAGKLNTTKEYLEILNEESKLYPGIDLLNIRSFMVKVVLLIMSEEFEKALEVLLYLQGKHKILYRDDDYFFLRLNHNLASVQFTLGNVSLAWKCVNASLNNPKRVMSDSGLEGLFYCHAIECLMAVEANDLDYATSRVHSIERKFNKFLKQPHNERNRIFTQLLKKTTKDERIWKEQSFRKEAFDFLKIKPGYQPGPEFVSFNVWLYSKLEKVPYNEGEYSRMVEEGLMR